MKVPVHVAIIPDGNRRWARQKGLPDSEGHRFAAENTLPELFKKSREMGVRYFTLWGLSTENLKKRNKQELDFLFLLFKQLIDRHLPEFEKEKVRFKSIGNIKELPRDIQRKISEAEEKTKDFSKFFFTLALNYGGRDEIVRAVNKILREGKAQIDKAEFEKYLDTSFMPPPDLVIRTGGEKRLSGFMLWQMEYSELYFSDLFFPDFNADEFEKAIIDFSKRERRFGK